MSETIKLPTKRTPAKVTSPKNLIIFGLPKVGKTTELAKIDNCLILDLEEGADFVDAMSVKIDSLRKLKEVGAAILAAGRPYKYVAIDTVTALEDMCLPYALYLYKQTPMGKTYEGTNVLHLPNGGGYLYLREAVQEMIEYIETLAPRTIIVGHLKDRLIESKGEEFNAKSLDLTGKLASLVAADSDAVGYVYRKNGELFINFESSDTVVCGSRCQHLKGYNGPLDWSKIYLD
jgi:hypothetical protein